MNKGSATRDLPPPPTRPAPGDLPGHLGLQKGSRGLCVETGSQSVQHTWEDGGLGKCPQIPGHAEL